MQPTREQPMPHPSTTVIKQLSDVVSAANVALSVSSSSSSSFSSLASSVPPAYTALLEVVAVLTDTTPGEAVTMCSRGLIDLYGIILGRVSTFVVVHTSGAWAPSTCGRTCPCTPSAPVSTCSTSDGDTVPSLSCTLEPHLLMQTLPTHACACSGDFSRTVASLRCSADVLWLARAWLEEYVPPAALYSEHAVLVPALVLLAQLVHMSSSVRTALCGREDILRTLCTFLHIDDTAYDGVAAAVLFLFAVTAARDTPSTITDTARDPDASLTLALVRLGAVEGLLSAGLGAGSASGPFAASTVHERCRSNVRLASCVLMLFVRAAYDSEFFRHLLRRAANGAHALTDTYVTATAGKALGAALFSSAAAQVAGTTA
jgi:hypothetical protein